MQHLISNLTMDCNCYNHGAPQIIAVGIIFVRWCYEWKISQREWLCIHIHYHTQTGHSSQTTLHISTNFYVQDKWTANNFFDHVKWFDIFYNASFLTHRQSYVPPPGDETQKFYNISSYANEKLFNHLRKSFQRLK